MLKASKIIGIRLLNYHEDGITWKDHKDKILDFWIQFKSKEHGLNPSQLKQFKYVENLPNSVKEIFQNWFDGYDFQNTNDKDWINWIVGKISFFYHTKITEIMPDDTWYIYLTKAEEDARDICETQIFHGNPSVDPLWNIETNLKSDEISGKRNGFIYSTELSKVLPGNTKDFYWAVAFQAKDSVKLFYENGKNEASKIISWAANCKNMTLLQITNNGRFVMKQVFVKKKGWKRERYIPQDKVSNKAYLGYALAKYFKSYYYEMFGIWEDIDSEIKEIKSGINSRKNAVGIFNDENVNVGKLVRDINDFIEEGNVSKETRIYNKRIRENIKKKNKLRDQKLRSIIRERKKYLKKKEKKRLRKMNPILSKK